MQGGSEGMKGWKERERERGGVKERARRMMRDGKRPKLPPYRYMVLAPTSKNAMYKVADHCHQCNVQD